MYFARLSHNTSVPTSTMDEPKVSSLFSSPLGSWEALGAAILFSLISAAISRLKYQIASYGHAIPINLFGVYAEM